MTARLHDRLKTLETRFGDWASSRGLDLMRMALGFIFVWFGVLKFCPGLCDVETLAAKTMQVLMLGLLPAKACISLLAVAECGIGAGLILSRADGRWMRVTAVCLMLHLCGTFLPMALFPGETWKHFPYAPTLVGQYILKNAVLLAGALMVAGKAFAVKAPVLELVPRRMTQCEEPLIAMMPR